MERFLIKGAFKKKGHFQVTTEEFGIHGLQCRHSRKRSGKRGKRSKKGSAYERGPMWTSEPTVLNFSIDKEDKEHTFATQCEVNRIARDVATQQK